MPRPDGGLAPPDRGFVRIFGSDGLDPVAGRIRPGYVSCELGEMQRVLAAANVDNFRDVGCTVESSDVDPSAPLAAMREPGSHLAPGLVTSKAGLLADGDPGDGQPGRAVTFRTDCPRRH
jgi:hypothetical protein